MTLEGKIPIKIYTWTHTQLDELLEDVDKKEYLVSTFCMNNNMYFDKQILVGIKKKEYIIQFDLYWL